ncbi:centromere protein H isoform X1 [Corvus kubaryi]|uniref:centromere protein H isoform X1 n=1 Tax=Corvus kubaryi TaxID=68294 RepID=UPI001C04E800|nr:centromere protein H isoform X1 [Corvus kubaryi]
MAAVTEEELDRAPALAGEMESALASALTRELELASAPARPRDGGDVSVLTLVRLRDQMKEQLMEYNTAILGGQENFPDHVIEEKYIQSASQDLQRETEEVKVSFQNKALALQRIQIMDILRNKVNQDDEESRLILETMKHIISLSQTIIEYQQRAHSKEQQLIDIKRKRLSLKKDIGQKLRQIQNMMKREREKQAAVNATAKQKLFDKLEQERQTTTVIQNVFQSIIIGSGVNWAEDPSLKTIVLQLEKNVS